MAARVAAEAVLLNQGGGDDGGGITPEFLSACLWRQSTGDGELYCRLHRGKFLYVNNMRAWLTWSGHHWAIDEMEESLAAVEAVAEVYNAHALSLPSEGKDDQRSNFFKRAKRLRGKDGRADCLAFARTVRDGLAIRGDELDTQPMLLACRNGVIDLETGRLRPGRPDDLLLRAANASFNGTDQPAAEWEAWLLECLQKQSLVDFLRRLCGYAITGLSTEHILPILWGEGRNGKGTLVEVLMYVLGSLSGPIQSAMLLDQGVVKNSSGPSSDVMELKGLRLAVASETDENRRFSGSMVKWYTGGDTLTGRYPYDKRNTKFIPTHTLFLMTNHLPNVSAEDYAFWKRVLRIRFDLCFVEGKPEKTNERIEIKGLKEKFVSMADAILAWMVRGCLEHQQFGLQPPDEVKKATEDYRKEQDSLGEWLENRTVKDTYAETESSELYDDFKWYWFNNISKKNIPKHKRFGMDMTKRFIKGMNSLGLVVYKGIRLISPTPED